MKVTTAESVVMDALWRNAPQSADDIIAQIGDRQSWSAGTVRTLLARLLGKGAITAVLDGHRYSYSPAIGRDDYLTGESNSLINRLFDGRAAPFVMHLVKDESISEADLAEIKRLIEDLENGR
ncbi:MAG: penicillinase repressor family protein [Caulobacteraceae bacterium]|nr:penicillinase repressor family protein [Caulobacteraceae bacterium]